jgi:hypothetical protein
MGVSVTRRMSSISLVLKGSSAWPRTRVAMKPWTAPGPPREAKRRGAGGRCQGWPIAAGVLAWGAEGFHVRVAVPPVGVLTALAWGRRAQRSSPRWTRGSPAVGTRSPRGQGPYRVDPGGEGVAGQREWRQPAGAAVRCPPPRPRARPRPTRLRRWRAGVRQTVETVDDQRDPPLRRDRERPQARRGFQARLATKSTRHHCGVGRHEPLGRPRQAFAALGARVWRRISHQAFN